MEKTMENEEIIGSRLSVLESRIAALEQQLFVITRGGTMTKRKPRRELTPEEKKAVRARLLAGQERKREEREAQIRAQAQSENNGESKTARTSIKGWIR